MPDDIIDPVKLTLPPKSDIDTGFDDTPTAPGVNPGAESVRGTLSRSGEPFDPAIHVYPPSENKKSGAWRKRAKAIQHATTNDELPNANYRKEAEKTARLYAAIHQLAFGDDGKLTDAADIVPMVDAWELYFHENGLRKMPTWAQLVISHSAYTWGVVRRPAIWPRCRNFVYKLFGKKIPNERPYTDNGDKSVGENEPSKTAGGE